jgi:hypothetical protein
MLTVCCFQEVTNTPDHQKNRPPKTAAFNPKCTGVIKEIMKHTIYLEHLRVNEKAYLKKTMNTVCIVEYAANYFLSVSSQIAIPIVSIM